MKTGPKVLIGAVLFVVALVVFDIAWDASAVARGRLHARLDIAHGHHKILGYGLPPPERTEYARLLKQRYAIEFEAIADCIVSKSLVAYADAYDQVVIEATKRKFGRDVFWETWEDAQRTWVHDTVTHRAIKGVDYLFHFPPAKARNVECFQALPSGSSMQQIVEHCGRPDADIGRELYVFVYHLDNGSDATITTPYLRRPVQIIYSSSLSPHY